MAQTKDSAIKLFGMTISLPPPPSPPPCGFIFKPEEDSSIPVKLDIKENEKPVSNVENQEVSDNDHNRKEGEEEEEEGEEKLSKPDKILPCPRCNSLETKFCYFNNYNVNQPRHFCRNCQRYWTAGGTMRNVPIGAGRRKNKLLRIHEMTPIRPANSETTHLTPIVNFRHGETKQEDHTPNATNHGVPIAPFVHQCNRNIPSNELIPLQYLPMPCWIWTLGGEENRNMQQPMVGSTRLGKHSRDDFYEEKMLGFKTPRRTDEHGKNS